MATAKVKLPKFRIGLAAVGRRLSSVMLRANSGELSREDFFDTINAVYNSCVSEDSTPDPEAQIDADVLAAEQSEIEKSVRRSQAARKAAERRRHMTDVTPVIPTSATGKEESQDGGVVTHDIPDLPEEIEQPHERIVCAQTVTIPEKEEDITPSCEEEEEEQEDEIIIPKYDAYGARIRWY